MKKKLIISSLVVGCMILFASCYTVTKTETVTNRYVVGAGIIQMPTVANLEVSSTKVSELFTLKANTSAKREDAKAFAVAKILSKHNADVLVEPRYSFETLETRWNKTFNIIVSGYPATFKNFRPATAADIEIFKVSPSLIVDPEVLNSTIENE
jgi:hypothetical protein